MDWPRSENVAEMSSASVGSIWHTGLVNLEKEFISPAKTRRPAAALWAYVSLRKTGKKERESDAALGLPEPRSLVSSLPRSLAHL